MSVQEATIGAVWEDGNVARGMERQLARRQYLLDGGLQMLGWKVGFTSPALLEAVGVCAPVVGFIPAGSVRASGSVVSLAGWAKPMLEPEIALRLGSRLAPGAAPAQVAAAVAAVAPAIELIDIDRPFVELEEIVAEGVFLRHVLFGPWVDADAVSLARLRGRVSVDGVESHAIAHPANAVGELTDIVLHVVECLAAAGAALDEGDIVITGSIVPAISVEPGRAQRFELAPVGSVEVEFAG